MSFAAAALLAVTLGLGAVPEAQAQSERVLYSFAGPASGGSGADGALPVAPLIADGAGNLFGTTYQGGANGCGTVFELVDSTTSPGTYTEKVLYNFAGSSGASADGCEPLYGALTMDSSGDIYGATTSGGSLGGGTVFELVSFGGNYTEKILYSFSLSASPFGGLVIDASGNLFGTTNGAGADGVGTVFELVNSLGTYTEKTLYNFTGPDGANPAGPLIMDAAGNLYGTTSAGGADGDGTVFEMVNSSGAYTLQVLYSFTGIPETSGQGDGNEPEAGLLMDSSGNLYGATLRGGYVAECAYKGCGTVFELANSSGSYMEKVLYSFDGTDGAYPRGLAMDAAGNLYGTTSGGGAVIGGGTFFELANSSGTYTAGLLYSFGSTSGGPRSGPLQDAAGNFYGTTLGGGTGGLGTVYEFAPEAGPAVLLSASALDFGNVQINTDSGAKQITAADAGSAGVTFAAGAVTVSGANAADFSIASDGCSGQTLAPNGTCAVSVSFRPSMNGGETASLNFADNAPGAPQTVALTGTGSSSAVTLSPASLTFPSTLAGATSAALPVTLTNTGTSNLTITSISSNLAAFAVATSGTTCSTSTPIAGGASCTINVTFTPSSGGADSGVLDIADNALSSPQSVALAGRGQDFGLAVASGTSATATISAGSTASYSLSLSPAGGFDQAVSLSCTGAPSLATCSLSPASVTLDGTNAATVKVTVTTTASGLTPPGLTEPQLPPVMGRLAFWLSMLGLAALLAGRDERFKPLAVRARLAFGAAMLLAALATGCGGGGGSSAPPPAPGTPAGTYTLTVTGTSTGLTHSTTVSMTVQ
jgi:uncharacterized repeat protein (TIGR03803 family)